MNKKAKEFADKMVDEWAKDNHSTTYQEYLDQAEKEGINKDEVIEVLNHYYPDL